MGSEQGMGSEPLPAPVSPVVGPCRCLATVAWLTGEMEICTECGLVYRLTGAGRSVDAAATRAALFQAAAACAGGDWGLAALIWNRRPADAASVANYHRLELAEAAVAALRPLRPS